MNPKFIRSAWNMDAAWHNPFDIAVKDGHCITLALTARCRKEGHRRYECLCILNKCCDLQCNCGFLLVVHTFEYTIIYIKTVMLFLSK